MAEIQLSVHLYYPVRTDNSEVLSTTDFTQADNRDFSHSVNSSDHITPLWVLVSRLCSLLLLAQILPG